MAQAPGYAPPAVAVPLAPPPVAAPAPTGFLASLGMMCKAKKERCCNSPLGKLLASATRPMSMMTGGILGSCCPPGPSAKDMASPGAVGAASKIQAEEAQAKARRAAVKFLGTVDCHYYPEAEASLIGSLRADRNECVRWEAAHALANGCCCNKRTIEALSITVSGSERDGNPGETSLWVKSEAFLALQFCLAHRREVPPVPPEAPPRPELPAAAGATATAGPPGELTAYYVNVSRVPTAEVIAEAHRTLGQATMSLAKQPAPQKSGDGSLLSLWRNSEASVDTESNENLPGGSGRNVPTLAPIPQPVPTALVPAGEIPPAPPQPLAGRSLMPQLREPPLPVSYPPVLGALPPQR